MFAKSKSSKFQMFKSQIDDHVFRIAVFSKKLV